MNQLSKSVTKQKEVKLFKQTKITPLNVFIERVVAFIHEQESATWHVIHGGR